MKNKIPQLNSVINRALKVNNNKKKRKQGKT